MPRKKNSSIAELLEEQFTKARDVRLKEVGAGAPDASTMSQLLTRVSGISNESSIRYLAPGRSGAKVVVLMNPNSLPVVVKFGTSSDIKREQENFRVSHIEDRLSQYVRPTLRQVLVSADYGLLVYSWAGGWEQVTNFREFFVTAPPQSVQQLLTTLIKELFPWHNVKKANSLPFDLWDWDERTRDHVFDSIEAWTGNKNSKEYLLSILKNQSHWRDLLRTKRSAVGTCHGDLNCYNVLISDSDALPKIIDFASVYLKSSPARDYAKMEREIKLRCLRDMTSTPREFIEALGQVDNICATGNDSAIASEAVSKAAAATITLRNQFRLSFQGFSDIAFTDYLYFLFCLTLAYLNNHEGLNEPKAVRDAIISSAMSILVLLESEVKRPLGTSKVAEFSGHTSVRVADLNLLIGSGWNVRQLLEKITKLDYSTMDALTTSHAGSPDQWLPVFLDHPDSWRALITSEGVVGYWHFVALTDAEFQEAMEGRLVDERIIANRIRSFEIPGVYNIYIAGLALHHRFRNSTTMLLLITSFFDVLRTLARNGIYIGRICTNAFTTQGESLCKTLLFQHQTRHEDHGEIYSISTFDLLDQTVAFRYSDVRELYRSMR